VSSETDAQRPGGRRRHTVRWLVAGWLVLLAASHAWRLAFPARRAALPGELSLEVAAVDGQRTTEARVRLAYRDLAAGDAARPDAVPLVLLHGSPGRKEDFRRIAPELARRRRVILPDLPGFGGSTRDVPDLSSRAHARYVSELLDGLGVRRAHVAGFSLGGVVAVELTALGPERVASLELISATGVEELELLGDQRLNHVVHGVQLALLAVLLEGTPHFGRLDRSAFGWGYGRNFWDTDQSRVRGLLAAWDGPTWIVHGASDPLVPVAAAREHHRIVPHSELAVLPGGHFLVLQGEPALERGLDDFLARVDAGEGVTRAAADPARVAAAGEPFDASWAPSLSGIGLVVFVLAAAAATLVSEDLTCVAVGALAGQGRVPLAWGVLACAVGIFVGDVLLFLAGRFLGRPAVGRPPLAWFLSAERVERSSAWFRAKGPVVILASRFLPGMRLPTYFAAGVLRTSFAAFALWFALAVGLWTPLVVWGSSRISGELGDRVGVLQGRLGLALLTSVVLAFLVVKLGVPALTWRGRRLLVSRWRRLTRWEFWPAWVVYAPLVPYIAWHGLRTGRLLGFTAVNPAYPLGGFVGESKADILRGLDRAAEGHLLATALVRAELPAAERWRAARRMLDAHGLPLVVKPDVGQRGSGVVIARDEDALRAAVLGAESDVLVQEYAAGPEFGLLYVRRPDEGHGRVVSTTEKRLVEVAGDGRRTLERLILEDERAVCQARFFLDRHAASLERVPAAGERVPLGELGTHCMGAVFRDGRHALTPRLEAEIDRVARAIEGFHLGRFDVRAASVEELGEGRFAILEVNGVTSEPGHVYHPGSSLLRGWRTLARQWRTACEIGAENARRGARTARPGELVRAALAFRARTRRLRLLRRAPAAGPS